MMNPALYTRWSTSKDGKIFYLTISGITSTGVANRFRVISYEVKYDHLNKRQVIDADKLLALIGNGKVKPCWSQGGSMMASQELIDELNKI